MGNSLKVLVIDDDASFRKLIGGFARGSDPLLIIVEAEDCESGLSELNSGAFDCVLLDYNLPGINGIELLQRMLATGGVRVPIIMLTGHGDETIAAQALKSGASDYLSKEKITKDLLLRTIQAAVRFHRSELRTKQAEDELVRSEKHYRTLVEKVSDIIFQLDPKGKITYVNPACRHLGYDKEELIGLSIESLLVHDHPNEVLPKILTQDVGPLSTTNLEVGLKANPRSTMSGEIPVVHVLLDAFGLWNAPDEVVFKNKKGLEFLGTVCICRKV